MVEPRLTVKALDQSTWAVFAMRSHLTGCKCDWKIGHSHLRFRPACAAAGDEVDDPAEVAAEAIQGVTHDRAAWPGEPSRPGGSVPAILVCEHLRSCFRLSGLGSAVCLTG